MTKNNQKEYKLFFLDTGIHPISKETRNHKIQLLLYSTLMLLVCLFFKENKIIMLLGVKFTNPIEPRDTLPLLLCISCYHFWMFKITFTKSMESWKNLKIKLMSAKEDEKITTLDSININPDLEKLCHDVKLEKDLKLNHILIEKAENEITTLKNEIKNEMVNEITKEKFLDFQSLIDKIIKSSELLESDYQIFNNLYHKKDEHLSDEEIEDKRYHFKKQIDNHNDNFSEIQSEIKKYKKIDVSIIEKNYRLNEILNAIESEKNRTKRSFVSLLESVISVSCKVNEDSKEITKYLNNMSLKESCMNFTFPYKFFPYLYASFSIFLSIIIYICYCLESSLTEFLTKHI